MTRPVLRAVILVVFLSGAAACGGSDAETKANVPPPKMPDCADKGPRIEKPDDVPGDLPIPPGTVFTDAQRPYGGQLVLRGVVPASLGEAAGFLRDRLPDAGYELGAGDSEPGEAESLFTGSEVRGGWRVNAIPDCEGAVRLLLVLVRQ